MKKFRWQIIIIFLTGLVVGILLLSEQPESPEEYSPDAIKPVQGGIYTEALVGDLQRLNPILDTYNSVDRDIDRLIFSSLVKFDDRGIPDGDLAESWGISQDGLIYNFTLQSDVYWHDGQTVTSSDVLFTVNYLKNGGITIPDDLQTFWNSVEVNVLNERNLQFKLPEPYAPFLDYLTFGILPEHLLGGMSYDDLVNSPYNLQPIGSGPYQFSKLFTDGDWVSGIELKRFDNYYGQKPYLDTLVFQYYPDSQSALMAYQDGFVQGISSIDENTLDDALEEEDLAIYASRIPELSMVFLNLDHPEKNFFTDVEVRRALLVGLNRQQIVDQVLNGQAVVTDSVIMPGNWAYYQVEPTTKFDPDRAKRILEDAGYLLSAMGGDEEEGAAVSTAEKILREKDGIYLSFTLSHPNHEPYQTIAQMIAENWAALGIEVILEPLPYDQLVEERLVPRDYQAALVDINTTAMRDPDPYPFWNQVQAKNGQNYSQWDHRMASEYLEKARVSVDLADRERLYHNFEVIFQQEMPSLPLYYPIVSYGIDQKIQGVRVGPLYESSDRFTTIVDWYLKAEVAPEEGN